MCFDRSGFAIDVMACLPYDALNIFDVGTSTPIEPRASITLATIGGEMNVSNLTYDSVETAASGNTYGNIFSILKVSTCLMTVDKNSIGENDS